MSVFASNFTVRYITEKYPIIIASAVLILVSGLMMYFVAKLFSKDKYERTVYEYSLVLSNFAGVGYSLALGILGESGLTDVMVFAIAINIYTYTYGYSKLTKRDISLKHIFSIRTAKMLLNPITVSMVVGMIIGLSGITLPSVISFAVGSASKCLTPTALLIVGIAIGGIMVLFGIKGAPLNSAVMFLALPCGMNTITMPKLFDENCEIGASMALVSNVLACVTIPFVLALFGIGTAI